MNHSSKAQIKTVLIVEDDADLAATYKELLNASGFFAYTATNGAEALRMILKSEMDAVICDLMMPHMAGDIFYQAVERVKPYLCQRFVFVTGYSGHPKFAPFLKKTNAIVLYKPVTAGKLLGTLKLLATRLIPEK